jgi:ABC-type enterochelin transport system permease subunit
MFVKFTAAIVALVLFFSYLVPVALKLKELSLAAIMLIGVGLMLADLWQSLQRHDP